LQPFGPPLSIRRDARLANWITEPANGVPRLYAVTVRGRVAETELAGPDRACHAAQSSARESHLLVELREGRNRQVRRMFDAIDREVTALKRVKFGGLDLEGLEPGSIGSCRREKLCTRFPERRLAL